MNAAQSRLSFHLKNDIKGSDTNGTYLSFLGWP